MKLPLAGFRILELATYVGAPGGTMLLSDMGAEVIKVEPATPLSFPSWLQMLLPPC